MIEMAPQTLHPIRCRLIVCISVPCGHGEGARKGGGLQGIIAGKVRRLRKGKGLSQQALADVWGYHRTDIGGIERGERNITRS